MDTNIYEKYCKNEKYEMGWRIYPGFRVTLSTDCKYALMIAIGFYDKII